MNIILVMETEQLSP